ncbi:MAG: PGF-CTERM sorting domain-containing protein, partial [Methanosarcinales archaeon]|nr:PGF-CTERM sorting domain-containing protein [Methanosarcinales archaeon]MCD4799388.1 PGF-CTERM sorting domain-containing protein [Methanosarcinales archaeon]
VGATMEPDSGRNVRGVFIVPVLEAFPPAEAQGSSSAELQQAVAEAKQAAEEAKQAAAQTSSSSTPGFGAILAVTGLVAALFLVLRRK